MKRILLAMTSAALFTLCLAGCGETEETYERNSTSSHSTSSDSSDSSSDGITISDYIEEWNDSVDEYSNEFGDISSVMTLVIQELDIDDADVTERGSLTIYEFELTASISGDTTSYLSIVTDENDIVTKLSLSMKPSVWSNLGETDTENATLVGEIFTKALGAMTDDEFPYDDSYDHVATLWDQTPKGDMKSYTVDNLDLSVILTDDEILTFNATIK